MPLRLRASRVRPAWRLFAAVWLVLIGCAMPATAQQNNYRLYAQDSGLDNLGILCLSQDRSGFILVGTEDGVYAFDGRQFVPFGSDRALPPRGLAYSIATTPAGRIYVAFSNALYMAEPDRPGQPPARFRRIDAPDRPIALESPHQVALLGETLLMVDRRRLFRAGPRAEGPPVLAPFFDPATLAAHPGLADLRSISTSGTDIWLGCGDAELCHVACPDGRCGPPDTLGKRDGLPATIWNVAMQDRSGTIWARSLNLLAHRAPNQRRFVVEPIPGDVGRYGGRSDYLLLAEAPDGRILTQGAGGILSHRNGILRLMGSNEGVPNGQIPALLFDRQQELWLGVRDQGLFHGLGVGRWENWTQAQGLQDNVVWQMSRIGHGPLWIASNSGVGALPATLAPDRPQPTITATNWGLATTAAGMVWHGTAEGGLGRYDPATGRDNTIATLPAINIITYAGGRLWIGTRSGTYLVPDPDDPAPAMPVRVAGIAGDTSDIEPDADGSVFALSTEGFYRVPPGGGAAHLVRSAAGLPPSAHVLATGSRGTVWVGSVVDGVQVLHLAGDRVERMDAVAMPVLGSNTVLMLHRDRRGWMWVGTDRGLDVWNGAEWRHVDQDDGLMSDDLDESSVFEDADRSMWFGTGHGVSHLLDPGGLFAVRPLHPMITSVRVAGVPLNDPTVRWPGAPLAIRFGALDFGGERSIRFRYRLSGVDPDWVETGDNEVRYPQLPPGRHVFSVQAVDPLKRRTSVPVSFVVRILPPWWMSWPFRLGCVAAAVILVTSLWRGRVSYIMRHQRLLEELVSLRTAEIESARAALFKQATRDSLTDLLNRSAIMEALELELATATSAFALALLDLDHFKLINDTHGHLNGDRVLREVSARLAGALRGNEKAGRFGGEELIVLIPDCAQSPLRIAALRDAMLGGAVTLREGSVLVTCSIGITWFRPGDSAESLLHRADTLLYAAKHAGRDRISAGLEGGTVTVCRRTGSRIPLPAIPVARTG